MIPYMKHIMLIARCGSQFRTERLRDTGLCAQHCSYILRVCRAPGTTQEAIAQDICVNKSNVTRQLVSLEQSGFIERRPSAQDSRAMEVYPTEKAQAALPKVRETLREWNEYITADFTEEEKAAFSDLLMRASHRAREYVDRMKAE